VRERERWEGERRVRDRDRDRQTDRQTDRQVFVCVRERQLSRTGVRERKRDRVFAGRFCSQAVEMFWSVDRWGEVASPGGYSASLQSG